LLIQMWQGRKNLPSSMTLQVVAITMNTLYVAEIKVDRAREVHPTKG
jgi:hypothetical protein